MKISHSFNKKVSMHIPTNLKYLIKKKGVTNIEVAEVIGISSSVITDYTKERSFPSLSVIVKFCEYFNVTMDEFIREDLSAYKSSGDPTSMDEAKTPYNRDNSLTIEDRVSEIEETLRSFRDAIKVGSRQLHAN